MRSPIHAGDIRIAGKHVPIWGTFSVGAGPGPAPEPINPGSMDWWITDRIPFNVANPPSGNTGSMDWWITDRLILDIWAGA